MDQQSLKGIPKRIIGWWKSRSGSGGTPSASPESGDPGKGTSLRNSAPRIGARVKDAAGEARTRGKGAVDDLQRRRQEQSRSAPGGVKESAGPVDLASEAASGASASARDATAETANGPDAAASTSASVETGRTAPGNAGPAHGSGSAQPENSAGASSVAWASTAGVINSELGNPDNFIEAEQGRPSTDAQQAASADPTAADRATTVDADTTAPVAGNAEEGTRNEAAGAAERASTDTPRDDPLTQAPDDPIGGPHERTPGTESGIAGESRAPDSTAAVSGTPPDRSLLGAISDDGSSITELEAEHAKGDAGIQSPSTTLAADAYRSSAAPEEVPPADTGSCDARHPTPGSTIPNFATDADSPTRTVQSPGDWTQSSEPRTGGAFNANPDKDDHAERPIGSGVTRDEPTSRVPGESEPVPDPASGQARPGADTHRRGAAGLGASQSGSSEGAGSFDDVEVADVTASDAPSPGMEPADAITRQDAAGAVDTSDPEGVSRSIGRDAARSNDRSSAADASPESAGSDKAKP